MNTATNLPILSVSVIVFPLGQPGQKARVSDQMRRASLVTLKCRFVQSTQLLVYARLISSPYQRIRRRQTRRRIALASANNVSQAFVIARHVTSNIQRLTIESPYYSGFGIV